MMSGTKVTFMEKNDHIAVIGAGSWGTALARHIASAGHNTRMWCLEEHVARDINETHCNHSYLPDYPLPATLTASTNIEHVIQDAQHIILVTPSQHVRETCTKIAPLIVPGQQLTCASKGIEIGSNKLMSDIIAEELPAGVAQQSCYLSGPSFARDFAAEDPTAIVLASRDQDAASNVRGILQHKACMIFLHDDVTGVEVGGAVKNVIAIACGIADGLGFGPNARAALMTRGLHEIIKIGTTFGANALTFSGLSGMGDLVLTCNSEMSRNFCVGRAIGAGKSPSDVLGNMVAEGVSTARAVHDITTQQKLDTPICTAVYNIVHNQLSPKTATQELLARTGGHEHSSLPQASN